MNALRFGKHRLSGPDCWLFSELSPLGAAQNLSERRGHRFETEVKTKHALGLSSKNCSRVPLKEETHSKRSSAQCGPSGFTPENRALIGAATLSNAAKESHPKAECKRFLLYIPHKCCHGVSMASRRHPTQYNPEAIQQANEAAARSIQFAKDTQRANEKGSRDTAAEAVGRAMPAYALPAGGSRKGMSTADQANVARSVRAYEAGGHMAPNTPQMRTAAPAAGGTRPAFGGSTPEEVSDFYKNAPAAPTVAAAGTGNSVVTPFGTASSRTATQGEQLANATTSDTGVTRTAPPRQANWQEQVMAQHPEIGKEGTPQNKAFVDAYKALKPEERNPDGSPKDHMGLAQQAIGTLKGAKGSVAAGVAAGGSTSGGIGGTAEPPITPQTVGQNIAKTPGVVGDALAAVPKGISSVVGKIADTAGNVAGGLYSGLTGNPNPYTPGSVPAALDTAGQTANAAITGAKAGLGLGYTPPAPNSAVASAPPGSLDAAKAYGKLYHDHVGSMFANAQGAPAMYAPPGVSAVGTASLPTAPTPPAPAMAFPPEQKPDDRKSDTANF